MDVDNYRRLKESLLAIGYAEELQWAAELATVVLTPNLFAAEAAWVILNSGMKAQVAAGIWERISPLLHDNQPIAGAFGHKGKAAAIQHIWDHRAQLLREYLAADDPLAFLQSLPWIGPITRYHLAKNLGLPFAKPDRHLVRLAGSAENVQPFCQALADASGDAVQVVDTVLWRAANLGLI